MTDSRTTVLLTGATGLLGRYLLRDLLHAGYSVAVVARDTRAGCAADRIRESVAHSSDVLGVRLPMPLVLGGDVRDDQLGLTCADRAWLARHCGAVIHSAANVSFRRSPDGEPGRTNTIGTGRMLELCAEIGVSSFHYISTAFVCGSRPGIALESQVDTGQGFNNDYERSKCEAEKLVRACPLVQPTIYRPSVIVGDSVTGYASAYHGLYRFVEMADRIAEPSPETGRRRMPLRMPLHGNEARNLVPVDWVSRAIVTLFGRPSAHGSTYHLAAPEPTRLWEVRQGVEDALGIDGMVLVGQGEVPNMTSIEQTYRDQLQEFIPYLDGDPNFDCRNTLAALPELPVPRVGIESLVRMFRYASSDGWGRKRRKACVGKARMDCADYFERHLPDGAGRSRMARIPIDVTLGLEVRGPGGGRWFCRWVEGVLTEVKPGTCERPEVTYRMDVSTFVAVVSGRESPPAAFLGQRIEIGGSTEKGLKLATLFGQFAREFPYQVPEPALK